MSGPFCFSSVAFSRRKVPEPEQVQAQPVQEPERRALAQPVLVRALALPVQAPSYPKVRGQAQPERVPVQAP